MSQSKTPCPVCERAPGGVHRENCPRSTRMLRLQRIVLEHVSQPRPVWMFGPIAFRRRDPKTGKAFGDVIETENPGLPFVRSGALRTFNRGRNKLVLGKPWNAGGLPKEFREESRDFAKAIGVLS